MARKHEALCHHRAFSSVADILRVLFAYALHDFSLRTTAAWAVQQHLTPHVSDVALLHLFRRFTPFLAALVQFFLARRLPMTTAHNLRVVAVDGTVIAGNKHAGNWKLSTAYAPATGQTLALVLQPWGGVEQIPPPVLQPHQVFLADRFYCKLDILTAIREQSAFFLIRATRILRLRYQGALQNPVAILGKTILSPGESTEFAVEIGKGKTFFPGRLVVVRCTEAYAERMQKHATEQRRRKDKLDPLSEEAKTASHYVFLLTSLSTAQANTQEILELFRARWQIELLFKRWKSILNLEHLKARGDLATTYLWTKLLVALVMEELLQPAAFSPWGGLRPRRSVRGRSA